MTRSALLVLLLFLASLGAGAATLQPHSRPAVTVSEGTIRVPTYENSARDLEPPLFPSSAVGGLYPFTTYSLPLEGEPQPRTYQAIFAENEYLKLTYVPELGGRFLELFDKLRKRDVFYKNDVIKPTGFNARNNWPQEGIELTGPFDLHSPTTHFEPFWSHTVLHRPDGSVTLMLGETDPIYGMTVRYSATLHPGVAALEINTFCFNPNTSRMPQMFWSNASFSTTRDTRFVYPMTRTVGHNTGQVTDWPMYEGVNYSYDRNNKNMLGVFGIDLYDDFGGSYSADQDYGVFRFADRRVVQGMKMWTFGHGRDAAAMEKAYTDKAGPYFEAQSGRHVWDGHYEWVAPHQVEQWNEWWIPVAGTGGLTTLSRDVALNLRLTPTASGTAIRVDLSLSRAVPEARLTVRSGKAVLLEQTVSLSPGTALHQNIASPVSQNDLEPVRVTLTDRSGLSLLDYQAPGASQKLSEYTPFTRELEKPTKLPEQMSAEELVLAAESHLKDLDEAAALHLLDLSLGRDAGYSAAHLLKGIVFYKQGKLKMAETELQRAVDRDPYLDRGWYYLAMAQHDQGKTAIAERNLYYIWPNSAFYGNREFQLARLELLRANSAAAITHASGAINRNGQDLSAWHLLSVAERLAGRRPAALDAIRHLIEIDPADRGAQAERLLLTGDDNARRSLLNLLGDQSQEALHLAEFYSDLGQWKDAVTLLELVRGRNHDPYGTSAVFFYTLAYDQLRAGDPAGSAQSLRSARRTADVVDRFPYLLSSEAPLRSAIVADPADSLARFDLGGLLYYLGRHEEAIEEWKLAEAQSPRNFSLERALGMAAAEQGDIPGAIAHLQTAVSLNQTHVATVNDLVTVYARGGRFADERNLLEAALAHASQKDDLMVRLLHVDLVEGKYADAEEIVRTHTFSPRHRDDALRDEYRALKYAEGARAFHAGRYTEAQSLFHAVEAPPASLGVDDFQFQSTPRLHYYLGRTLEALGRKDDARQAYEKSVAEVDLTAGDRASFNSDSFYMLLSLTRLGRQQEVAELASRFEAFARSQLELKRAHRRAEGEYLLGLLAGLRGSSTEAARGMEAALGIEPDFLMPRFDLRHDSIGTSVSPPNGASPGQ